MVKHETGFGAIREEIKNRPLAMSPLKAVAGPVQVKMEDIRPPFGESNWDYVRAFKLDRINGEWYWSGLGGEPMGDHWARTIPPGEGFFVHPTHPDELVRIAGMLPSVGVYIFRKRQGTTIGQRR